jgi:outer membrane protein TolC
MLSLFLAVQVLTLGDAVSRALQQNPSQQVALSNAAVADEQAAIADAARWPVVTADARVARWQMKAFLPKALLSRIPEPISVIGPTNDFSAGVDVRYTVWDSGRRDAEIGAARAGATAAHADVDSSRVQLAFAVHEAYFRLLATNAAMDAARARLGRAEDHVKVAAIRKEEGASPQIDVVRARVEVARAKADVAAAQADAAVARGTLNTLLGPAPETPLELAPVTREPAFATTNGSLTIRSGRSASASKSTSSTALVATASPARTTSSPAKKPACASSSSRSTRKCGARERTSAKPEPPSTPPQQP